MGWSNVYITAHGRWKQANFWAGEYGQIGVKWSCWPLGTSSAKVSKPNFSQHSEAFIERDSTLFNESIFWEARSTLVPAVDVDADLQLDMAEDMHKFLTAIKGVQSSEWEWTHIKVSLEGYGDAENPGKYLYGSSLFTFKSALSGSGAGMLPPEVSVAVSNRAQVIGRSGRGRIYVPALANPIMASNGTVNGTQRTTLLNAFATLHTDLGNLPGLDTAPAGIVITSPSNAYMVIPKEVRCGDHFDVQRRRQHQVAEGYTSIAL